MTLDVPTLMAMGSFVSICAGVILLFAWVWNRKEPALALWGLSDLFVAIGIVLLMVAGALQKPLIIVVAGNVLVFASGLLLKSARAFDGRPTPIALLLLGPVLVIVVGLIPVLHGVSTSLGMGCNVAYLIATIVALWPSKKSKLPARWPIIGFVAVHATVLTIGAYSTWNGVIGDMMPPLLSSFGLIHFESIIFSVGTAVFVLALVKERSEAVTRIAAGIDSLTGIANRAAFTEDATAIMGRCRQEEAPVSVIMFDLDRFKSVNDTHGHAFGDAVIKKFCEVTTAALRPGDVFGRLGGEEFAVVLPWSSIEPASIRADRIRTGFAEASRKLGDSHINTTVSGGVSASASGEATLSELLADADVALYRAKAAGRNRIKRADQPATEHGASVIRVA